MSLTVKLDTPQARIFPATRSLSNVGHNAARLVTRLWPVQKVKIEIISAETGEARLASARDAVSRHVIGPHLGDQEYAVALTGNYSADQFLGTPVAVHLRRIDQRHPKRNACS